MKEQAYIFEVAEQGFPKYVIENSDKLPVLVEFMGVWSEPCVVMADTLGSLAQEFAGQFVFARVDIDEQPGLKAAYNIQHVPTLMVFRNGGVEMTQEGQMQEEELRLLLKGVGVFRASDELRSQAREKHLAGDTPGAILLLTQAIREDPGNTRVAMDMVQVFIDTGELEQAKALFHKLPGTDRNSEMGKSLTGQLAFADLAAATAGKESLLAALDRDGHDHDARFDLAVCLVNEHQYDQAMEQLFTILGENPDYKEGAVREMIITIIKMLTPNDHQSAATYRKRLSNMLNQ